MPVRVKLNDSIEIIVNADTVTDVRKALNEAMRKMELLAFTNHDGHEIVVNPAQVLYVEAINGDSPNGSAPAATRKRRQPARSR